MDAFPLVSASVRTDVGGFLMVYSLTYLLTAFSWSSIAASEFLVPSVGVSNLVFYFTSVGLMIEKFRTPF